MSISWYLLHCKARQEMRARSNIENQGHTTCLPQVKIQKRVRGKKVSVTEALFPNYLFVQLDSSKANFNALRSTRGVTGFVRFGGVPVEVPSAVVHSMQELEAEQAKCGVAERIYAPGSHVEVIEGPFAGLKAVYQMAKGEERCLVLLDMLGKQQRIELDERVLRSA